MHNETYPSGTPKRHAQLYVLLVALGVFVLTMIAWDVLNLMVTRKFEVVETHLVLKSETCQLLRAESLPLQVVQGPLELCSVTLPFRAKGTGGGVVYLNERQLHLADHQLVTREIAHLEHWTANQIEALVTLLVSSGVVLGLAVGIILHIRKARK